MSRISVHPDPFTSETAFLELVGADLETQKASLSLYEPPTFDVEPGLYLLQAHWSSGERTRQVVEVRSGDLRVDITPPSTEAPGIRSLGDSHGDFLGAAIPDQTPYAQGDRSWVGVDAIRGGHRNAFELRRAAPYADSLRFEVEGAPEPHFALWRKHGVDWEDVDLAVEGYAIDGGFEFSLDVGEGLHLFEVSVGEQRQYVSIPAERSIVAVRRHERKGRLFVQAEARTADRDIEALRGYITRGELDIARGIAFNVMAEGYLQSKAAAPRIAALGAYFLLRVGDLNRLHDWPDNLTRWKEWLPDGPVISAWQRLRSPHPDYDEVFHYLLEAERRGLPVYTEGVRLLKDGLDLFASDDERDWDVDAVRSRVEEYARAMLWNKSETTYFGYAPDKPHSYVSAEGVEWAVL